MPNMILRNIGKTYNKNNQVVKNFNLEIKDKEFIIFVGPSGCGKSTTLRMMAGLEKISTGEFYIDNQLMNYVESRDRELSMVFQNYALYPNMSVYDNMAFSLQVRHVPKEEIREKVLATAKVLEIEHLLDNNPKNLSGGQKQRVAIGSAIVRQPKAFLMDEPLSNLDAKLRAQMRIELKKLHEKLQTTIVYVTHDQTEAMTLGTRIVVLKDGIIQQVAAPQIMYENPINKFVAGFIGSPSMNFIEVKIIKQQDRIKLNFENIYIELRGKIKERLSYEEFIDKKVILGIRPEDIYDDIKELDSLDIELSDPIQIEAQEIELLGPEIYLHFNYSKQHFIARLGTSGDIKAGDKINIRFDLGKIALFDIDNEQNILYKAMV